jgi:hypothetical protein
MGKASKPAHGQIRIDKDGSTWVSIEENTQENSLKSDTITPDSVRDKEFEDLRSKLRKTKIITWVLFFVGLVLGAFIHWALTAPWG